MREEFLFEVMQKARERRCLELQNCPVAKRTKIPNGCKNNIYWQLGHIITVTELFVFGFTGEAVSLPSTYQEFFSPGTKPDDWREEPPAWETMLELLKEQPNRIRTVFTGRLNEPAKENSVEAETVSELLQFYLMHESIHGAIISTYLKIL